MRTWYLVIGAAALYGAWMLSTYNTAWGYIISFVFAMIGGQFISRGLFKRRKKKKTKRRRYY